MVNNSYVNENKDRFLKELFELLRIPSVSADSKFKDDVRAAANFLLEKLNSIGVDASEICETNGHPIVYAEKLIDPSLPTVLIYGHYDVQPADPYELWTSDPFEPILKDDKIFARGACDDKGQMYMHVKAFETMTHTTGVPYNLKFLIEGEEEVGSENLDNFVKNNKEKLKADVVLISDTSMIANDVPSITVGLRGLSYLEVEVIGPNRDLHSGRYGGAVANPIEVLCSMIKSLKDTDNRITIPGFYDKVKEVSIDERSLINEAPFDLNEYMHELGIKAVHGEKTFTTIERTGIRPALDVNGIWGGYIGEGAKTVLPSKAQAKISMRLVPNQSSEEITRLFKEYFESIAPEYVNVKVAPHHGGEAAILSTESVGYKAASLAFEEAWGKKPIPTRDGGSIPVVSLFQKELGLESVMLGFGLDSDAIHSPNESFGVFNYLKGIETITLFHKYFLSLSNK